MLTKHVGGAGLFSTPSMIMLMELTAHDAVEEFLPEGHTTVGYEVCVRHLAPAREGNTIVVGIRLTEVKENRLHFDVECVSQDGDTMIGTGTHKRAVIPELR